MLSKGMLSLLFDQLDHTWERTFKNVIVRRFHERRRAM